MQFTLASFICLSSSFALSNPPPPSVTPTDDSPLEPGSTQGSFPQQNRIKGYTGKCKHCSRNSEITSRPTWRPADVQHVADDVLSVLVGLPPGHPHRGGRQGFGPHVGGLARQPVGPEHGEAGAGLRGAGTVLSDALVDGLVILADAVYGQRAAGGDRKEERRVFKCRTIDCWDKSSIPKMETKTLFC